MTMMDGDRLFRNTSESEFTDHAADHLLTHSKLSRWTVYNNDDRPPLLEELDSSGYSIIERHVKKTFPNCNIKQIHQVFAPQMYGMYMLRREEMKLTIGVQDKLLYHVTTESRALQSLDSGLDWRRTRRSKFGCGVSFSDDADYANYYADKFTNEDTQVLMMCSVLIGEKYVIPRQNRAGNSLIVPPDSADTTVSFNSRVYVKYNDNEFYPLFFVYYEKRPEYRTMSKYQRGTLVLEVGEFM